MTDDNKPTAELPSYAANTKHLCQGIVFANLGLIRRAWMQATGLHDKDKTQWEFWQRALYDGLNFCRIQAAQIEAERPIDMVLHCPRCHAQHVDAPEESDVYRAAIFKETGVVEKMPKPWTNPPHRSHLCHDCGFIWRPADVCTNGVAAIKTKGSNDCA